MRRPDHSPDEPLLFDLPLAHPEDRLEESPRRDKAEKGGRERAPKGERGRPETGRPAATGPRPAPPPPEPVPTGRRDARSQADAPGAGEPAPAGAPGSPLAGAGRRLAAGAADLMIHGALMVGIFFGCRALGVQPELADWPPLLLFGFTFSFFYSVVPLAFWGHTLGMAWAGLVAQNRDGEPLTFDQTARRWLGGLLTLALAGLPLLTALRGRTLSDLLSGSETRASHHPV